MARSERKTERVSSLFSSVVPGKRWKIFFPRNIIWQKWEKITGEAVSQNAWPWYFQDLYCLVVAVSDNIWLQQLTFQKDFILERLNTYLPEGSRLEDLRFVLADVKYVRKKTILRDGQAIQGQDSRKRKALKPDHKVLALLENLSDKELKDAFNRLLKRLG